MKLWPIALALFAGGIAAGATQLPDSVQNVLTLIDAVPTQLQLDNAFTDHEAAAQGLTAIASDPGAEPNARLHAISALAKYCVTSPCVDADPAHRALVQIIRDNTQTATGTNAIMLRAAIEALGPQRAEPPLAPMLSDLDLLLNELANNTSRDIRTAVAHSLRDLCNTQAIAPLRQQQQTEPSEQVKQAITEALRVLGQGSPCQ
jgi:HEAT repeat protein